MDRFVWETTIQHTPKELQVLSKLDRTSRRSESASAKLVSAMGGSQELRDEISFACLGMYMGKCTGNRNCNCVWGLGFRTG